MERRRWEQPRAQGRKAPATAQAAQAAGQAQATAAAAAKARAKGESSQAVSKKKLLFLWNAKSTIYQEAIAAQQQSLARAEKRRYGKRSKETEGQVLQSPKPKTATSWE